jgi:hypothetical protein
MTPERKESPEEAAMEIAPVTTIRLAPMPRARVADLSLPGVFDIESASGMGDETYTPAVAAAAGGAEEDEIDAADDEPEEGAAEGAGGRARRQVNFFA